MGTLHATMNVTLDGCCDHSQVIADAEFHEYVTELFGTASALLFGRVSYELLRGYWPGVAQAGQADEATLEFARRLGWMPKHVVTGREVAPGWSSSRMELGPNGSAVRTLAEQTPGVLLLVGSPSLSRTLLELGLLDEYHLAIQPIFAGRGPTFLAGSKAPLHASLLDTRRLSSGVVVHRYAPQRPRG
jgi:dihydrofolate reductase